MKPISLLDLKTLAEDGHCDADAEELLILLKVIEIQNQYMTAVSNLIEQHFGPEDFARKMLEHSRAEVRKLVDFGEGEIK